MTTEHAAGHSPPRKGSIEAPDVGQDVETGNDEGTGTGFLDSDIESHPDSSGSRDEGIEDPERSGGFDSQLM